MIMSDLYSTKTAALKATKADVSKLNTKSLKVNGKDVATSIKHPNDTREVITENDLWGSWAEITKNGEIVFHEDEIVNPNKDLPSDTCVEGMPWNSSITKIENNKAYIGDVMWANIQTERITENSGYDSIFRDCSNLISFNSDLSSLTTGALMFNNCHYLTSFTSDLSSLTDGYSMFTGCWSLTSFTSVLSSLTSGWNMFSGCSNLTTFTTDLSSLTDGSNMFHGCNILSTFTSDLSSLTDGDYMFCDCWNLTSFTVDLRNLTNGCYMFSGCSKLTTFVSDLSSLTNGHEMFYRCKLDTDSLIYIAETIKDVRDLTNGNGYWNDIYKTIHIGIGNAAPTEEEKELLTEIHNKGWQVFVSGNGSYDYTEFVPTAVIPEDGEMSQIIPFYAKPVESDEEHAEYVGEDGKYYNILGGQFIFVDDPETYGMFVSLEDAAANMRLTKIEKTEIETA